MRHLAVVVEDDEILRSVIAESLALLSITVVEFSNADDALAFIENHEPMDLLVTDVHMPGTKDGLALAQFLWKFAPSLSVIVISGHAIVLPGTLPSNAIFLRKPFSVDALHDAVAALVQI